MNPTESLLAIQMADDPAAHERLVNLLRRRSPSRASWSFVHEEGTVRVTVALRAGREELQTLAHHLAKIVDVVEVRILDEANCLAVETAIVRLTVSEAFREGAIARLEALGGRVLGSGDAEVVGVLSHASKALDAAIESLEAWGAVTALRTGPIALCHGAKP